MSSRNEPAEPTRHPAGELAVELIRGAHRRRGRQTPSGPDGRHAVLEACQGAQLIRTQMTAHIAHIEELNRPPSGRRKRHSRKVLADTSALADWPALYVGTPGESWKHFERVRAAAREAEDRLLLAFATADQVRATRSRRRRASRRTCRTRPRESGHCRARPHADMLVSARAQMPTAIGNTHAADSHSTR
jgi:hypothetical protein